MEKKNIDYRQDYLLCETLFVDRDVLCKEIETQNLKNLVFFNFPAIEHTFLPKPEEMRVQANEHNVQRMLPSFKFPSKHLATGATSSLGWGPGPRGWVELSNVLYSGNFKMAAAARCLRSLSRSSNNLKVINLDVISYLFYVDFKTCSFILFADFVLYPEEYLTK